MHLFRHAMATIMLGIVIIYWGADIRYVQAMLGHIKIEITITYAWEFSRITGQES